MVIITITNQDWTKYTVSTPGLLQKMSKKCSIPGEFPGLVVF